MRYRHAQDQLLAGLEELAALAVPPAGEGGAAEAATREPAAPGGVDGGDRRVVVLRLGADEYGAPVERVRRVVRLPSAFAAGSAVEGAIELRGRALPLVDLVARLGVGAAGRGPGALVVVVEVEGGPVGLLVDGVPEVLAVPASAFEPPAEADAGPYVVGVIRMTGRLVRLLDLDAALVGGGAGEGGGP